MEHTRRIRNAAVLLILALTSGVGGFMFLEGWPFHDALYMTVITLTTVGFREVQPLDTVGQYFTMVLLFAGVGTVLYTFVAVIEFVVEGHFSGLIQKRRTLRTTSHLTGHYILCGYGRVGQEIAREFTRAGETVVVIEHDGESAAVCAGDGYLCIKGDAIKDETLLEAGINKAKGLLAALSSDTKNVVVTLTARTLNPSMFIVARAEEDESHRKLKHAGANRAISPYAIGGRRMATLMMRPYVTDYLDFVTRGDQHRLRIEEVEIPSGAAIAGLIIDEARIGERTGSSLLAIYQGKEKLAAHPSPKTRIGAGDILLVMGDAAQLQKLNGLLEEPSKRPNDDRRGATV